MWLNIVVDGNKAMEQHWSYIVSNYIEKIVRFVIHNFCIYFHLIEKKLFKIMAVKKNYCILIFLSKIFFDRKLETNLLI
jgi:hypothetical protein